MKAIINITIFVLFLASSAIAKRISPAEIPAITTDQVVYSVPHFGFKNGTSQNGGVIHARDPKTKKLLWSVQVYKTVYNKALEGDVQDVFIKSLSLDETHNLLIMSDEKLRVFVLNLTTRKVTQIRTTLSDVGEKKEKSKRKSDEEIAKELAEAIVEPKRVPEVRAAEGADQPPAVLESKLKDKEKRALESKERSE